MTKIETHNSIETVTVRGQRFSIPKAYLEKALLDFKQGHGCAKTVDELAYGEFLSYNSEERKKRTYGENFFIKYMNVEYVPIE